MLATLLGTEHIAANIENMYTQSLPTLLCMIEVGR